LKGFLNEGAQKFPCLPFALAIIYASGRYFYYCINKVVIDHVSAFDKATATQYYEHFENIYAIMGEPHLYWWIVWIIEGALLGALSYCVESVVRKLTGKYWKFPVAMTYGLIACVALYYSLAFLSSKSIAAKWL